MNARMNDVGPRGDWGERKLVPDVSEWPSIG